MRDVLCKKGMVFAIIFLFVGAGVVPNISINVSASNGGGYTIYVDDDADPGWYNATHVATIAEGVANASAGQTIYVYSGTYPEFVDINKPLTLMGENKYTTIITNPGGISCMWALVSNITISGFTMRDSEGGIGHCSGGISHINISDNIIEDINGRGIIIDFQHNPHTNITISNNIFRNVSAMNVHIYWGGTIENKTTNITITNNTFEDTTSDAININGNISNSVISHNTMNGGGIALFQDIEYFDIFGNEIENAYNGIELDKTSCNNTISYNNVTLCSHAGINVDTEGNYIYENNIYNCGGAGIWFQQNG